MAHKAASDVSGRTGGRSLRRVIASIPVIGPLLRRLYRRAVPVSPDLAFEQSTKYWNDRYSLGGNSGAGSYGRLAHFKADVLNEFVAEHGVRSVIEFGSGDGAQLELARYPQYTGIDVSQSAIDLCTRKFARDRTKRFHHSSYLDSETIVADLGMSLDVIYHLVEDEIFDVYMSRLVTSAERYICIYSSNYYGVAPEPHIRHRCFTDWLARRAPQWRLLRKIPNPYPADPARPQDTSWADFYFFERDPQISQLA